MSSVEAVSSEFGYRQISSIHAAELTPDRFLKAYKSPGILVVMTGLLDALPAWNLDYLCQQLGDHPFPIRQYCTERYQLDKRQWDNMGSGVTTSTMSFTRYAALLRDGTAKESRSLSGEMFIEANAPRSLRLL